MPERGGGVGGVKVVHTQCGPGTGQSGDLGEAGPRIPFWNTGCTLVISQAEVRGSSGSVRAGGGRLEAWSRG